ncbi:hypothetical protein YPPY46_2911, partial [Yersinia pestis PY-46]
MGWLPLSG